MEDKDFLMANVLDRLVLSTQRNKIVCTPFYAPPEMVKIEKELKRRKEKRFFLEGGYENAERKSLFFYPEKMTEEMAKKNLDKFLAVIHIQLPRELVRNL